MDAQEKIVQRRLSLLRLAEELGNVSEACRLRGVSRSQFYVYERRYEALGPEGLKNLPPIHHSHPMTTSSEIKDRVLALSLKHPFLGCNKLETYLGLEGIRVSATTIQKILNLYNLGTRSHRWLTLESLHHKKVIELSPEQTQFIEKQNPAFRERNENSNRPGKLLIQNLSLAGTLKRSGQIFLHAIIDTFSLGAFGMLLTSRSSEATATTFQNKALPFYRERKIPISTFLTSNDKVFCGSNPHPYETLLKINDIKHIYISVQKLQANGYIKRFNRIFLDEFNQDLDWLNSNMKCAELQVAFDDWLLHYNSQRPQQGYPNMGKYPMEAVETYLEGQT